MGYENLNITRGVNKKPASTEVFEQCLSRIPMIHGEVFTGYPLIATPDGKYSIDATLVSPNQGIVLIDLVEGTEIGNYTERQDDLVNKIEARLKLHRELVKGRELAVPLSVITFAPAVSNVANIAEDGYPLVNEEGLAKVLTDIKWQSNEDGLYRMALSAIESLSSIRKNRSKREVTREDSRGAKLKQLENSIATLDHRQNKAVIETIDGVQRIRGLAGSGKTIVLALKAAYLHTQHPNWRIAVTFHTRSLKGQFKRLINNFCIEQSGEEPDWTKIRIINAWGAPGGAERDGIYYEFCRSSGQDFYDFKSAANRFGGNERAFDGACQAALAAAESPQLYDVILADESQDFAPSFLRLCYEMLREPKRLVYAYDELQNLSGISLPPPEEIFGTDEQGQPRVSLGDDKRRDVILQKCYRNSRPVLVTAHGLGFGVYRPIPTGTATGLVQMFDQPTLWEEIGYHVRDGHLTKGQHVVLERTDETSPRFLEIHSQIDDIVHFECFANESAQNDWLISQILHNLKHDELRHDDIIVIHPEPLSARDKTGAIRKKFFELGIQTHLAGVDTDADVFFRTDTPSITFTGIYRAKGNEAGMVYIINAQDCDGSGAGLASLRNRLFTAITRSKAWVRVIGYGQGMRNIMTEFQTLKQKNFTLDFTYPTDELLGKLRIVHRDLSPQEKQRLEKKKNQVADLVRDLESGELLLDDLDIETKKKLQKILGVDE